MKVDDPKDKSEDVLSTLKATIEQLQNVSKHLELLAVKGQKTSIIKIYFQDLATEKQNNERLIQIRADLEKEVQEQIQNSKQYIQNDELDGLNERLRNYETEFSQLQKDCLNIKSISENELEDERTKLCK